MADTDNDWLEGLNEEELTSTPRSPKLGKSGKEAFRVLPRALIESVIGMAGIKKISEQQGFCLIVEAPSSDWVAPLHSALRYFGEWHVHIAKSAIPRGRAVDDGAATTVVQALAGGGRIVGVSQSPRQLLPPAMVSAADLTITLPLPSPRVIAATIKAVTGKLPKNVPDTIAAGLTFDDIASSIRPNSTPQACIKRMERAQLSKRRAEVMGSEVPEIKDLHGYGEAKVWALNLIEDLDAWRRGELEISQLDRNIVLASLPGLGKTSFVRSLARSTGLPLIATSVGAWFANSPGYLDSVIKQIDEVFADARAVGPAIVLLDELEGLPSRASLSPRNSDWWLPVIGHMLTVLDGATSVTTSNLIVIGATNHPEKIDPAIMRPGRLNRFVYISPPDETALCGILRQHLGSDLPDVDLIAAARLGVGRSGAHVVQWVKAARRTARAGRRPMVMGDLLDAIAPEDTRPQELLRRIAIHEAGHAVVAHTIGLGAVKTISIVASGNNGGRTIVNHDNSGTTKSEIELYVAHALGGRAAEEVILGDVGAGSGGDERSDLGNATSTLGLIHLGIGLGDSLMYRGNFEEVPRLLAYQPAIAAKVEADLRRLYLVAVEICRQKRLLVDAIAVELLERRHVDGPRFLEIIAEVAGMNIERTVIDNG
ncbi:AAA family ATPase [Devosia sp. A369]